MEGVAYLTHKYLMHGPLWFLHRSHHVPHAGFFERNDLFGLLFALPSIALIDAGVRTGSWMLPVGLGMTAYGALYFLFHDVVVHHVSVIAIQAGAARMVAETGDGAAALVSAWRAVEETARLALTELRQLLGTLRHEGDPPSLTPQPGLRQLGQLLAEVRAAGLPVRSDVAGIPDQLPPALDLSAYRIVQEALTNIMKHEGLAPAVVRLCCRGGAVEVEVTNEAGGLGATGTLAGPGRGLIGMRERAEVLGGSLHAGPCAGGGFRVRALLPLDGSIR